MKTLRIWLGWSVPVALLVLVGLFRVPAGVRAQIDVKKEPPVEPKELRALEPDAAPPQSAHDKSGGLSLPDKLPVASKPEFRLPAQAAQSAPIKQAAAQQPLPPPLAEVEGPAVLHSLHGPLDVFVSASEIEKGKPHLSRVIFTGVQELGGKRFLTFQKLEMGEEIWLIDTAQIAAIRGRR